MGKLHQDGVWYVPVCVVLILGYVIGAILPLGIYYHGWFETWLIGKSKLIAIMFFLGVLGSTTQLSVYLARDVNNYITDDGAKPPANIEFFGYLLKQVWGGLAAVMFVLALEAGFIASFSGASSQDMRLEALVVVSFVCGLRAFSILKALSGLIDKP